MGILRHLSLYSVRVMGIFLLALGTLHCAKKKTYSTQIAPISEQDLGLIVKTTPSQLDQLTRNNPEATVRILSAKNGIYEIQHVSVSEAQKISSQKVYKNEFIKSLSHSHSKNLSLKNMANKTSADAEAAFKTCVSSPTAPDFQVDLSYSTQTLTVELGQEITISASSLTPPAAGSDVRFIWDMRSPKFSQQKIITGISNEQKLIPDSVGLYQFLIVAQGADFSCSQTVVPLFVTANPELTSELPTPVLATDLSAFTHLGYVEAAKAWLTSRGKNILVAVLDSGVNYNHPGIRANIFSKSNETVDTIDNDNNGLADDTIGWDFVNNDRFPFDDEGHGSHVAGLIASPVLGVAPDAQILPVKILNAAGSSDTATIVAGIYFAVDSGAHIINASVELANSPIVPQPLWDAIEYARSKDVIFVAAAGNGDNTGTGYNITGKPVYPASFALDNVISVAATAKNVITNYSNFSPEFVHVGAPGGNSEEFVISLATLNPAQTFIAAQFGTSMACPVTAGVVALMLSSVPPGSMTPYRIRQILMDSGTALDSLKDKTSSGKQVNAANAVKAVQSALDFQLAELTL